MLGEQGIKVARRTVAKYREAMHIPPSNERKRLETPMQLNISGHHVELTPSLKEYVSGKFEKLERHFDHISNCQVTLEVEKVRQLAEATLHVIGGEIHAKAESEDMYAAIDALVDKLDRQILKHKEKNVDRMHGNGAR
ncbi:unnamed protein product [Ectocarpus sp. 12 AP-2014]